MNKKVISIGSFDGIHLGHHQIVKKVKEMALNMGASPGIFTFVPLPSMYFGKQEKNQLITNSLEKSEIFKKQFGFGIESLPFNEEIANLSAHKFIKNILIERYNAVGLVMGVSHFFGKDKVGNYDWLKENQNEYSLNIHLVPNYFHDNVLVNSSNIRELLIDGKISLANKLLGYPFTYEDTIIHGDKRGREIGFPTANFSLEDKEKILPANGIYAVMVKYKNDFYKGLTYIGHRPTFSGVALCFETHLFNFDETIYGEKIRVFFVDKIRRDIKFDNVSDMISQMIIDKKNSLKILEQGVIPNVL